jgi:hypothetical protein
MIYTVQNRYLRGLLGWALVLGFIAAFPFLVIYGAAVDAWQTLKQNWLATRQERRDVWRVLTFRRV